MASLVAAVGCRRQSEVNFTQWAHPSDSRSDGNGAFAKLRSAGEEVATRAELAAKPDAKGRPTTPLTSRTVYYPKQRADAKEMIGPCRAQAIQAVRETVSFQYTPTGLSAPPKYLSGLRLIGNSILWDEEDAVTNRDFDHAIEYCGSATRLGFALMGGGANEASLGASLINQARIKMIPIMGSLSALQLSKLGAALQQASVSRPAMQVSVDNELDNMLLCLQQAQDAFASHKLDSLQEKMGASSKDVVDQLKTLENDPLKGKEIFDWLGNDINNRADYFRKMVKMPKKVGLPPKFEDKKQYRMLYRYFGTNIESLVPLLQSTYCRTQLFILDCYLKQRLRQQRDLPKTLKEFSDTAVLDPYTGEPFYYLAGSSSYLLYSAGPDGIDNGGKPGDVVLEGTVQPH